MDLKMEVYTPMLELVGLLEVHRSVIWEDKAFTAGSFSTDCLITPESKTLLVPDNVIWIEGATAGTIEYFHENSDQTGAYLTVKGPNLTGILQTRILWGRYDLTGTPPEIMCALVNDCCVNPTRGDAEVRKIPGLVLLDPPAGGDIIHMQRTGGYLLTALEELGAAYGVAFGVRFNPAVPQMEFWTRWGQDRTVGQAVNDPVFYSRELDDVLSSEYSYNAQDYRNVVLVAGEGEGNDRVMVVVENDVEEPPTPPTPTAYTITLAVDPSGGGTAIGGGTANEGQTVTVRAVPSADFEFVEWRENGAAVSTSAVYSFKANGDRTLTAVFAAVVKGYRVTVQARPQAGGAVTGAGQYQEGETVTLTATPSDGYKFTGWQEGGQTVSTNTTYSFTVTGDRTLVGVFEEKISRLPAGYTEVEYVTMQHTSGFLSYVDTGQSCGNIMRCVLDIEFGSPSKESIYFGTDNGRNSNNMVTYFKQSYTTTQLKYQIGMATSANAAAVGSTSGRHTIDIDNKTGILKFDGKSITMASGGLTALMTTKMPYRLYATNYAATKWYSVEIYKNGTLTRQMIPCKNSSGMAGFYDLVYKNFYTLTGTTGTITAGPAV